MVKSESVTKRQSKTLSKKIEKELFEKYKKNNDLDARNTLIQSNLGLIHVVVNKISNNLQDRKDFIQEGYLALEKAIENFDYDKKVRFSTYCYAYIEHEIKNYILNQNKYAKLTKKEKKILDAWTKAKLYYANLGYERVTVNDLAEYLKDYDLDIKDIYQIEYKYYSIFPKETEIDEFESTHSLDSGYSSFKDELTNQNNIEILEEAMKKLSEKERDIINKKYGLNGEKPHTLQEIGELYGVSRERIRQIKTQVLFKIERQLVNKF